MTNRTQRGRDATSPSEISSKGWRDILLRTKNELASDHVSLVAAGAAFYGLLAFVPGIGALIAIWGLAFDAHEMVAQIEAITSTLPRDAATIITDQARAVAAEASTGISLAGLFGLVLGLYSASKGMKALIEGFNIAYDEEESRGFVLLTLTALVLTGGVIVVLTVALGLIAVLPMVINLLGLGQSGWLISLLRWPFLFCVVTVALAVLYRYAPDRERPQWRWVSPGALVATSLWLAGSGGFSFYVSRFGSYNETYGSIGAVVVLLLWFWLSAFIVLLGAELDAEIEHQTARDTTTGAREPMGERGAYVADHLGAKP